MSSLRTARRRALLQWSAAVVTAAALYALPVGLVAGSRLLVADLAVLVAAAVWLWSPLAVLAAAVLSGAGALVFFLSVGDSPPGAAAWVGALVLMLPAGAWGVRRGAAALAVLPCGWLVATAWVAAVR